MSAHVIRESTDWASLFSTCSRCSNSILSAFPLPRTYLEILGGLSPRAEDWTRASILPTMADVKVIATLIGLIATPSHLPGMLIYRDPYREGPALIVVGSISSAVMLLLPQYGSFQRFKRKTPPLGELKVTRLRPWIASLGPFIVRACSLNTLLLLFILSTGKLYICDLTQRAITSKDFILARRFVDSNWISLSPYLVDSP